MRDSSASRRAANAAAGSADSAAAADRANRPAETPCSTTDIALTSRSRRELYCVAAVAPDPLGIRSQHLHVPREQAQLAQGVGHGRARVAEDVEIEGVF